jgi:hypothetical protein
VLILTHIIQRVHIAPLLSILQSFHLDHLVEELSKKDGIHSLRNILSLIWPLHEAFDRLDLWFDETEEVTKSTLTMMISSIFSEISIGDLGLK